MPTFTETEMREALAGVISTAAPNAKVFSWWSLGHKRDAWPGQLKPEAGADLGKVHGYIVTRTEIETVRRTSECVRRFFTYDIWGFYKHTTGNSDSNSDFIFNAELDAICNAFTVRSSLPQALRRIKEDSEIEFRLDLDIFGGELLHYATGRVVIEQC